MVSDADSAVSGLERHVRCLGGVRSVRGGAVALACVFAGLCWIPNTAAQKDEECAFEIGGLLFGDIYHVVRLHTDEGEGATGVVVRRGYLTFDADFSERWFGRLHFEVNQSGEFETYVFEVDFKDLYENWNIGSHRVLFGLSSTQTIDLIESIWSERTSHSRGGARCSRGFCWV